MKNDNNHCNNIANYYNLDDVVLDPENWMNRVKHFNNRL